MRVLPSRIRNDRDVTMYWVMGMLAMMAAILAPFVLIPATYEIAKLAGAGVRTYLISFAISLIVSFFVSKQAYELGKAGLALSYKAKHGVEPPWNR